LNKYSIKKTNISRVAKLNLYGINLLPANLLGITNSIAELKALDKIRKRDFQEIFTKLESIAKVQSVKG